MRSSLGSCTLQLVLLLDLRVVRAILFGVDNDWCQKAHEVKGFSTWMTFGGNTQRGDGVTGIKRHRRDLSSDGVRKLTTASGTGGNLRELSGEEAWEAIDNFTQGQKEWDNPLNIISEQELVNLKAQAKRLFGNENVWVEMHRGIA
ncbi:hypothetical protein Tco_1578430 [Tanacetum coccineum]